MEKKQPRNFNRRYAKEYNWFRTLFYYGVIFFMIIPYMTSFKKYKIMKGVDVYAIFLETFAQ